MFVLAEPLVLAAFGDQWLGAVDVMQLFVIYAVASPITLVCGTVFKARGKGGLLLRIAIFQVVLIVPAVAIVVDDGIEAVAICQAALSGVVLLVQLVLAMRMLEIGIVSVLSALWPPAVAALALSATVWAVDLVIDGTWAVLGVAAVVGAVVYGGLLWLLARESLRRLAGTIRPTPTPATP
jgi:O-antigen/teichoic acid export membrane protein